jgi:protein-tyrosine phosphatase
MEMDMSPHRLTPAVPDETGVFGSQRPGYPARRVQAEEVTSWIEFMRSRGIGRVVCLLPDDQLSFYSDVPGGLLQANRDAFGANNVLPAPITDYHLCGTERLTAVMRYLDEARAAHGKVVVHCSGGGGRTGHILAAWLVHSRGVTPEVAIEAVTATGRQPREAVLCGNATERELLELLDYPRRVPWLHQTAPAAELLRADVRDLVARDPAAHDRRGEQHPGSTS